jgi:hypothetical protein
MNPLPIFVGQFAWFLVVWTTIAVVFVAPRLRAHDVDGRLMVWLTPQLFRVLGAGLLVPSLAPGLPRELALPTAIGDASTAVLALVAILTLHRGAALGRPCAWLCTVVGSADLAIALVHAARIEAARYLAAQWYVPVVVVPLAIVSHVMAWRVLLSGRGGDAET